MDGGRFWFDETAWLDAHLFGACERCGYLIGPTATILDDKNYHNDCAAFVIRELCGAPLPVGDR